MSINLKQNENDYSNKTNKIVESPSENTTLFNNKKFILKIQKEIIINNEYLSKIKPCNNYKHKYASNKHVMIIITKYKRNRSINNSCNDIIIDEKSKKPIVQFLALKKKQENNFWLIPTGFIRKSKKNKQVENLKCSNIESKFLKDLYEKVFVNSRIVFKGYLNYTRKSSQDSLNEVIAENCHHYSDYIPSIIEKALKESNCVNFCLDWIDLFDKNIYPPYKIILKNCAERLNAHWINLV